MDSFFIDVGALREEHYTGIPEVTAKLCAQVLGDETVEPRFFYNRHEVRREIVEQLLVGRDGRLFGWAAHHYCNPPLQRGVSEAGLVMGLHTNRKMARRLFPVEGQIVHDFTTLVMPHHHLPEIKLPHQRSFYGDLMSNDVTFCVSESTAADLRSLYGQLPGSIVVSHLGVDWSHVEECLSIEPKEVSVSEPYVLVLGTMEPRKNVGEVLDLLAAHPELALRRRFVFGGRGGWGDSFETQVADRGLSELINGGRILNVGFVDEAAKYALLRSADALIYPSLYEGFGLPVAEAISLNTPVVTTASSSLPEVGRDLAFYFLPGDLEGLAEALNRAFAIDRADQDRCAALANWQQHFSWSRCYRTIRDAMRAAGEKARQ